MGRKKMKKCGTKPFVMLLKSSTYIIRPLIIETKSYNGSFELISLFILFTMLLYSFWWNGPGVALGRVCAQPAKQACFIIDNLIKRPFSTKCNTTAGTLKQNALRCVDFQCLKMQALCNKNHIKNKKFFLITHMKI